MKPGYNRLFLFYLRLTFKYFLRLSLWRLILYTALFVFTDGNILVILLLYWEIKAFLDNRKHEKLLKNQQNIVEKQ